MHNRKYKTCFVKPLEFPWEITIENKCFIVNEYLVYK